MLLAIDIGNSTATYGIFSETLLTSKFSIPTIRNQTAQEIFLQVKPKITQKIKAIVISTVVRELEMTYLELSENFFKVKPFLVDHDFDFGFSIKYSPPESCGTDRLVAAFAALSKHTPPLIICDFGTATTIDAVNAESEYLGGIITPGLNTLAGALFEKTSKLPKVEITKPEKVIGNTTVGSILSGIYFGYIGLVDGLIERISAELGGTPQIVATGGLAPLISEESRYVKDVENELLLDGLRLVYEKTIEEKTN